MIAKEFDLPFFGYHLLCFQWKPFFPFPSTFCAMKLIPFSVNRPSNKHGLIASDSQFLFTKIVDIHLSNWRSDIEKKTPSAPSILWKQL